MTKQPIRKFALELQYSNMIIVARITFIYQWLLSNFFIFTEWQKIPSTSALELRENLHKRSARRRLQCVKKMIGYRRSSEMIRYMPAGHASKLTKILRASPQRNFKLDKEKAPMAQPQSNETSRRKHNKRTTATQPNSRWQSFNLDSWPLNNWIFKKAGAIFIQGWRSPYQPPVSLRIESLDDHHIRHYDESRTFTDRPGKPCAEERIITTPERKCLWFNVGKTRIWPLFCMMQPCRTLHKTSRTGRTRDCQKPE